ncbi:MAG: glutathione S-transferase family protein [Pseudomonadota bacterium]
MTDKKYTLYGAACSLYTAKARSYLRKQGIDFVEQSPNNPHYNEQVLPKIGRFIIPVLETPQGEVVQDGSEIIHHFEERGAAEASAYPESYMIRAVAFLFELFGGEGLLRPAMHFRWDYDEENLSFLKSEFSPFAPEGADEETLEQVFAFASGRMRKAKAFFGVSEAAKPLVAEAYQEFLRLFEAHLRDFPYILGRQPSLADYALMGPLYGHLYRDPVPSRLMRQQAPRVARWVERMNTREEYWGDHNPAACGLAVDAIPDTLKSLMRFVAQEYLPEIRAHVDFTNRWLDERPDIDAGTNGLEKPGERSIGMCEFDWRGIRIDSSVMPYRFYLLQRLQDCYDEADTVVQQQIEGLFAEVGLSALLTLRTRRRVERRGHLEVWGELR